MSLRKVTIFFNQDGKDITIETAARTLGELKDAVKDYDLSNKKIVERQSRHTFDVDDAVLPEGDFTVYVYPRKSKAGASIPAKFKKMSPDKLHTYPLTSLREVAVYLNKTNNAGLNSKETKDALQKSIRKWMIKNSWPEAVATTSPGKASKGAGKLEKELKSKIGSKTGSGAPSASAPGQSLAKKRIGPATLDMMDDKLDLILERLDVVTAKRVAVPAAETPSDLRDDANRLKKQLGDVQG